MYRRLKHLGDKSNDQEIYYEFTYKFLLLFRLWYGQPKVADRAELNLPEPKIMKT